MRSLDFILGVDYIDFVYLVFLGYWIAGMIIKLDAWAT